MNPQPWTQYSMSSLEGKVDARHSVAQ